MRSYNFFCVFLCALLLTCATLLSACKGDTPSEPTDPSDIDPSEEDIGVIYPPDSGGPHCVDAITVPDVKDPELCETAADCEGVFDPVPTCQVVACEDGECVLEVAEDGTECDDGNVCTGGETCQAGECGGGEPICECEADADCAQYDSADLCAGRLKCDTDLDEPVCVIDPETVVTCEQPDDACKVSECNPDTGACEEKSAPDGTACDAGDPCTAGDFCEDGACQPGDQNICACPEGMVAVGESHCIDQYEASRPDATATQRGRDNSRATSRAGVLPWMPVEYAAGRAACQAAGKRLCTPDEFESACSGPTNTTYTYGNTYNPTTCNGIDTFCRCDSGDCADVDVCPYPHCYNQGPGGAAGPGCGADLKLMPTGSFPGCANEYGAFDLSGNVWELVDRGDGESWYAGGAYNCFDAEALHQCDAVRKDINARGFRCCADYGTGTAP